MTTLMTMEVNKVYHELYSARLSYYKVLEDGKKELKRTTKLPHHATMEKAFPNMTELAYFFDEAEYAYHIKDHLVLTVEMRCRVLLPTNNEYRTEFKTSKRTVKFVVPQDVRITNAIRNLIRNANTVLAEVDEYTLVERTHFLDNFAFSDVYMKQLDDLIRGKAIDVYRIHNGAPRTAEGRFAECSNEQLTN